MNLRVRLAALILSICPIFALGCDSSSEDEPTVVGDLSGAVSDATDGALISGATVRIAGITRTTGADGAYSVSGIETGSYELEASASGYDAFTADVAIVEGVNTRDVALTRQSVFDYDGPEIEATAFVPPGLSRLRGVLLVFYGAEAQSQGFVRGDIDFLPQLEAEQLALRAAMVDVADDFGLAIVGFDTHDNSSGSALRDVYAALDDFAAQTGHPQFAEAPVLIWGASFGGCYGYFLIERDVERVIGWISQKGGCHPLGFEASRAGIPSYLFIGENDTQERSTNITRIFLDNRAGNAIWALAVHPGGDHYPVDLGSEGRALTMEWMREVLSLRLPDDAAPDGATTLNPIPEASGWLGNRGTYEIAPFDCYTADPLTASWMPTRATAESWQHFVSEGTVTAVTPCP